MDGIQAITHVVVSMHWNGLKENCTMNGWDLSEQSDEEHECCLGRQGKLILDSWNLCLQSSTRI